MTRITVKTLATSALVSLGLLGAGTIAAQADSHAAADDMAEIQSFQAAAQTLQQAITAAETQLGGVAMSAEFDAEATGGPTYDVEVLLPDGTTKAAMVSAKDGTVVVMASDTEDQNGEDGDDEGGADGETGEAAEATGN